MQLMRLRSPGLSRAEVVRGGPLIACAGPLLSARAVEVGQHVSGAMFQCSAERHPFGERVGTARARGSR